jgi:tellurite resistance protein
MGETGTVELTRSELEIASNALNEVLHGPQAIEEWEFHTRMGVTRGEAEMLLQRLRDATDAAR